MTKHQCQALNEKGKQCRRIADKTEQYHGDDELYDWWSGKARWVKVWLCKIHREGR